MPKIIIYLLGMVVLGAVKGFYPDVFRDPVLCAAGVLYVLLVSFIAHRFGK